MQHIEQYFSGSDAIRDVVIGIADASLWFSAIFGP
jgi:hypothetical protein